MIAVGGRDFGIDSAVDDAQGADSHTFAADADAAVAENAAGTVVEHHGAPLLFGNVDLFFGVAGFANAVFEDHVLQFALAALVADRAIERMVCEQEFEGSFARLDDGGRFGPDHHAFGHRDHAGGHQFRRLFNLHQTHAAGRLERHAFVVAECRNLNAGQFGGVDQ